MRVVVQSKRLEYLDALRGIASMIVIIFHCLISFPIFHEAYYDQRFSSTAMAMLTNSPLNLLWSGKEPVLLFFILSGFVLAFPFLHSRPPVYLSFAIKRLFRIYIPYIIVMLISIVVMLAFAPYSEAGHLSSTYNERWHHPPTVDAIIAYITMVNYDLTNVNGVVWTLFHEMRISLVFPLIMFFIVKMDWKKAAALSIVSLTAAFYGIGLASNFITEGLPAAFVYSLRESVYYTGFFILGALLAKYKETIVSSMQSLRPLPKLALGALCLLTINIGWTRWFGQAESVFLQDSLSALGIAILFAFVLGGERLQKLLRSRVLVFLGNISYSLYLIHIPVIMLCSIYLTKYLPIVVSFLLVPFLSILISVLLYKFIEAPSMRLGKRVSTGIEARLAPAGTPIREWRRQQDTRLKSGTQGGEL